MKTERTEDTRTLEQILAGEQPPSTPKQKPVLVRKPISAKWFWGGLAAFAWLIALLSGPSKEEQARIAQVEQEQKAKVIVDALRQHKARVDASIARQQVFIGMNRDDVIMSWGSPLSSNVTLTAHGKHEQLVYSSNYLYLTDDVLTSIQSMN